METTEKTINKLVPQFSSARCKRCGICSHFCPVHAIDTCDDGLPILADPVACTSCGLCRDMCPDWAISLEPMAIEVGERTSGSERDAEPARTTTDGPSGNGAGASKSIRATVD